MPPSSERGAAEVLGLDVDRVAADQEPAISAPENEPSQRWCARGSGSAAPRRNCLSLKSKLKLRWSTGSRPTGRAGQRLRRPRQAAKDAGRALGGEGRIAGQQLVGAVAAEHDLHLARARTGSAGAWAGSTRRRTARRASARPRAGAR